MALQADPDRGIDRPVGDLAVAHLDVDRGLSCVCDEGCRGAD
jgi:hypothetical protein